jgi:diaminohydroxyphosphoribosylaminopyrimidine deaminase / 5-amino-6-(5-phosphoribosylamino)uracil reductase
LSLSSAAQAQSEMLTSPAFSVADHEFMAHALRLAERGQWTTSPNPRVGCVLVTDGKIVGEGWHVRAGEPHAEIHALRAAGAATRGATAYVTLEPCSHHGRTPPCSDALIEAGIGRVVAAMQDPNPLVAGQGLAKVRAAGIAAEVGLLEVAAKELNIGFVTRMTTGRPWVRVKLAASLDGRTALAEGESQWITGPDARRDGHRWRARASAILTGSGTVLGDDPQLTVRAVETERQPLRVVVDGAARVPAKARIFSDGPVLWVTHGEGTSPGENVERLALPDPEGHVDLAGLLDELGRRGVNELHVEAGPRLAGALLRLGLVDELLLYLAPCLIGDTGRGLFGIPELASLADKVPLQIVDARSVGHDLRIVARIP